MLQRIAIRADKPIPIVVKAKSELSVSGDGAVFPGVGVKPKIESSERYGLSPLLPFRFRGHNRPPAQSIGHVNEPVLTEGGMVGSKLRVFLGKSGEPGFFDFRLSVVITVRKKRDFARQCHDHSIFPRQDTRRK